MKDFKKYYIIPAKPEEIYLALTKPATIQLWTGEPAEMSTEPGSEFSLWDGSIVGRNIAFEESKLIKRMQYNEMPVRVEYSLTDCGKSLLPLFYEIAAWWHNYNH